MNLILDTLAKSVMRDAAVSLASVLAADGIITHDQTQGVIGSVFFLGMIAVNAFLHHRKAKENAK